jgi:hypothetical protein
MGAGAVNASLIARLPRLASALGPVAGVSYRVASRIKNSLGAGEPVRDAAELGSVRAILFHSSPEQCAALLNTLTEAAIAWPGKSLLFCDCRPESSSAEWFRSQGASVASLRRCALPGRLVLEGSGEGSGPALALANRLAKDLAMKAIELNAESAPVFEAAMTLGSGVLTPLIDQASMLLRQCGVRDTEAPRLAAALFEQTSRDYGRTGRQSWAWYQRAPDAPKLLAQINAAGERLRGLMAQMVVFGMEEFGRHADTARAVRRENDK